MVTVIRTEHPERKGQEAILVLPKNVIEAYYFSQIKINGNGEEFVHRDWQCCDYISEETETITHGPARAFIYKGSNNLETAADRMEEMLREVRGTALPKEVVDKFPNTKVTFPEIKNIREEFWPIPGWKDYYWAYLDSK